MRKLIILLFSAIFFITCAEDNPKVLLFVTDGSRDLELMLTKEVIVMKEMLEQANLDVVVSTLSGESVSRDTVSVETDLKLSDVSTSDYAGFIFPCMAPPWEKIYDPNSEVVAFIKKVSKEGKPMASQTLSVADFAKAGILVDMKYAFTLDPDVNEYPEFKGGIFSGEGVIQDGNIITSGTCPWKAREFDLIDGTPKLTQLFIQALAE
jgi:putative intracellular protease/amidase